MKNLKTSTTILLAIVLLLCSGSLSALLAQGSQVSVSPTQLTFNVQSGSGTSASQNLFVSSNTGSPVTFTATAFSSGNWLSVSPNGGTTPAGLSVVVNPGSLGTGSYNGFINIASGGNVLASVPVTMNINVTGASPFTASPNTLSFSFQSGSTVPQTQPLTISLTAGGSATFSATASTSNNGNWLSVNPPSGSTPANLNVSVDPSSLGTGSFTGAVTVNSPGASGLVIPVSVTVGAASTVTVTPQQLSFAFQLGAAAPAPQTLTLTSTGGGSISFSATASTSSCGSSWLVVSPQSSATPSTLSVQINPTGLPAGTCAGTINISAPGASNPTQSIPVSLLVSANPLLQVPSTGPTFNYQLGTAVPAAQTVQITSSGAPLNFTVAATPVSGGPNFLTILPNSGTTPQGVSLSVTPSVLAGLAPNTYVETVSVSSTGAGNSPQNFNVTLVVSTNPTLVASQSSAIFNFQVGQAVPPAQVINITSSGAPLTYTVAASTTTCPGFLSASPTSGTTQVQAGQTSQVAIAVNTSGLTTGQTCSGTITISVPGSSNALTIPVTLNVSTTPLINLSPSAINAVAVVGSGVISTANIALTSTDGTTSLNFSATATTNPAGLTWLSVTPNSGTSPTNLVVTINPSNLAPGVYTGTINVSSTSPNVPAQTVPVTLTVATGTIAVTPTSLTFNQALNGPAPASRTLQVTGIPSGATLGTAATVFNGSGWLAASASGATITVSANGSQLSSGTYSGVVTVFVPGASNSPFYVPVTLSVGGPPPFTTFPATLNFSITAGSTVLPAPQTVQLSSAATGVQFNAVAVAPPGSTGGVVFVTVTPATGTTPANLSIGLNASTVSTLAPGNYTNLVTLTSPATPDQSQSITVTLNVAAPGPPSISAIDSGASFQTGMISPGEIITIFGANIGPAVPASLQLTASGMIATSLSNTQVTFNGVAAPLIFVSSGQINAVVPYEVAGSAVASVVVIRNGVSSTAVSVNVVAATPALFTLNQSGSGQGAILNQDFSGNGPNNAAARGSIIILYATGEGVLTPPQLTGSVTPGSGSTFPKPVGAVTVMIGGVQAQILYAGEAPGYTSGLLQVNAVVPTTIGTGNQPVVLTVGNIAGSSAVTAAIK